MGKIGIKVQDVVIGRKVYYYPWCNQFENDEPEEAIITNGPVEIGGTLCCFINIRSSCVALSNLSTEKFPKKSMSAKKRRAKERYARFLALDDCLGISFGDYVKYRVYERVENNTCY